MNEKEWLKSRLRGIGGSEASAILGLSPYLTNQELFKIKTKERAGKFFTNPHIEYGKAAEKYIRGLFALDFPDFEVIYSDFDCVESKEHPFIIGTVDGRLIEKATGRKGFLEIKTSEIFSQVQETKWTNEAVPQTYYIQVLHYFLACEDFEFCKLRAQIKTRGRIEIKDYHFERSELKDDLEYLLEEEVKFWDQVKAGIEPSLRLPQI